MDEKRRYARWQVNRHAKVKLAGAQTFASCKIHDIGLKGLKISLPLKLPPDTFLNLKIVLSDEFILDVEAWIVWRKGIEGVNVYGLYFSKIPDEDKEKVYQFMRRYFLKQMSKQWWPDVYQEKGGETMQNAKFEDRRIFARLTAKIPLKYLDVESGREGEAQTLDVSAKGIGLVSAGELKPRTPLEMWLKVADRDEPFYTRGEVVWSKPVAEHEYRAGISLERADLLGLSRALRAA